jgi:hypothetical protein
MKIKTLVAMLFLSAGATTVVAQDANCNSNSSISHEDYNQHLPSNAYYNCK